ncbi:hypothetical protein H5410_022968 [Solanum commersonii]|uniref:Uncharacterized protein n=1 Tax=Solanum commersonii TaxID=4109 RepID=A0A9J5ZI68_SOLCO|nr:hypothetical protein H5410_022968 [Solanum commersonii]
MREFLLLCEHLDTHPIQNSNLKGNINPNKVAGDVPLAPSAQNISKVYTDMPISKSKDEEKSRENEASSSSSAKAEKIISGKPESKTNAVPSGTKVFSSFQVGKQHPKEEEYLSFTRYIYNLSEESGETYGVLGTTSLFPRISIFPNGLPSFTAQLFEFGYLDRVYTKPDLKELSRLRQSGKNYARTAVYIADFLAFLWNAKICKHIMQAYAKICKHIMNFIKQFHNNDKAKFMPNRLPTGDMECKDMQAYYPTLNYITIEKIKDFNVKATGVDKKLPHLNKKWIQTRRAIYIYYLFIFEVFIFTNRPII